MAHFWNPQSDQIRWFLEQRGYMSIMLMHDWLFVKKDSEYAEGALDIVRNMRQKLADETDTVHRNGHIQIMNPFND